MNSRLASLMLLGATCASAPCHAALWSSTNEVVRRGQYTTMTVSLTGDGVLVGAQVDIALPAGVSVVSATARNGATCARLSSSPVARVLWIDAGLVPLPAVATPMCDLRLRVTSSASALWLNMQNAVCVDGLGASSACALDRGHLTITP
jgi:hypothetical protein